MADEIIPKVGDRFCWRDGDCDVYFAILADPEGRPGIFSIFWEDTQLTSDRYCNNWFKIFFRDNTVFLAGKAKKHKLIKSWVLK